MSRTLPSDSRGCLSSLIPLLTSHPSLSPQLRKTEGKAAPPGSTELPPEYLTSPLSQQSQVIIFTSTMEIRVILFFLIFFYIFRVSNSSSLICPSSFPLSYLNIFWMTRCPPREMRQLCRRRRSCSWPSLCPKVRQRRRSEWLVARQKF